MWKSIRNNIPNAVTSLNLLCGALAVVAAFKCHDVTFWGLRGCQLAFLLIALGAVADFCDGLVARLLGAVSGIGRELDSLSDLVTFGLAPAMVVYNLLDAFYPGNAWCLLTMMIPVFGALRLARFNVSTDQTTSFRGLPIPANAIFWIGEAATLAQSATAPQLWVVMAHVVFMSVLMVCDLRMFSFKLHNFDFKENWAQFLLIIFAVVLLAVWGVSGMDEIIYAYICLSAIKCMTSKC